MNGYTLMANSYKKLMNEGKLDKNEAEKEIRIFEFLATCDTEDIYRLVDSSAFNDIIRAYLKMAVVNANIDEESQGKVLDQMWNMFDMMNAKEVVSKY